MARIVLLFTIVFSACVLGYNKDKESGIRHEYHKDFVGQGDSAVYKKSEAVEAEAVEAEAVEGHKEKTKTMIGRCTLKRFTGSARRCLRKFFMVFRRNKNANCYKHFDRIDKCVNKRVYYCLNGTDMKDKINEIQKSIADALTGKKHGFSLREIYCGTGPIKLPDLPAEATDCSRKMMKAMKKDMIGFYETFRRNRADRGMCEKYTFMVKKIFRVARTVCKQNLESLRWLSAMKFNPFCSKKQYHH